MSPMSPMSPMGPMARRGRLTPPRLPRLLLLAQEVHDVHQILDRHGALKTFRHEGSIAWRPAEHIVLGEREGFAVGIAKGHMIGSVLDDVARHESGRAGLKDPNLVFRGNSGAGAQDGLEKPFAPQLGANRGKVRPDIASPAANSVASPAVCLLFIKE